MLTNLSIQNYALIQNLSIDFTKGFTTISGETGAGKSILLGGLGLILGQRADLKSLMNPDEKCILEGQFYIADYTLKSFFKTHDLDYEEESYFRRELLPSGKSRAFINDTPVSLQVLNELQSHLIDIHSQHQTHRLNDSDFQFSVLDALAKNQKLLREYSQLRMVYVMAEQDLEQLKNKIQQEQVQHDFNSFLLEELQKANFKLGEQENLEEEMERLQHYELIQQSLGELSFNLGEKEAAINDELHRLQNILLEIKEYSSAYASLHERLMSTYVELKDIYSEVADLIDSEGLDQKRLDFVNTRLDVLYSLQKKHQVENIAGLLEKQAILKKSVYTAEDAENILQDKENELKEIKQKLVSNAATIHKERTKYISSLEKEVTQVLHSLGMPAALFKVVLEETDVFYTNGRDRIQYYFSANKGSALQSIQKVASGGELSRIMLAVKSVLASYKKLPTLIFDEIDAGISGEVALKMGDLLYQMSQNMQVIVITHLPQIAAKGNRQLKVFKSERKAKTGVNTYTDIKALNEEERIVEIAELLGGKNLSQTAIDHAKQLLGVES